MHESGSRAERRGTAGRDCSVRWRACGRAAADIRDRPHEDAHRHWETRFCAGALDAENVFEVLEVLHQSAPDARLDQIDFGSVGARFASECKTFCMVYVHFLCNPLVPEMLHIWEGEIHRLYEGYLRREREAVLAFLRAKAMFFGLRGTSYPWATLVERHSTSEAIRIAMESLQIAPPNAAR